MGQNLDKSEKVSLADTFMSNLDVEFKNEYLLSKICEAIERNEMTIDDIIEKLKKSNSNPKTEYEEFMDELMNDFYKVCERYEEDLQTFMGEVAHGNYDVYCFDSSDFEPFLSVIEKNNNMASNIIDFIESLLEEYCGVLSHAQDEDDIKEMIEVIIAVSKYDICEEDREKCDELKDMYRYYIK